MIDKETNERLERMFEMTKEIHPEDGRTQAICALLLYIATTLEEIRFELMRSDGSR